MGLRVMIGRSGTGKTTHLLNEVHQQLLEDPMGPPIWIIVPDQMTFHMEQSINQLSGIEGMTRLNVFSFSRLALRVLENVGGSARKHLSQVGTAMLIRKAVEEARDELRVFKKTADQRGFYDVLQRTFSEFKHYGVTEALLREKQEELEGSSSATLLNDKLLDLQRIYGTFNQSLRGKYIDSDDYLTFAAEKLPEWQVLQEATVYFDGFDSFTPQEWAFMKPLFQLSHHVTLTLTMDTAHAPSDKGTLSLFKRAEDTYEKLKTSLDEWGLEMDSPVLFQSSKRFSSPMIRHLEKSFDERPYPVYTEKDGSVSIMEATNRRTEIEETARHIQHLVVNLGQRYQDITVLVRDLSTYRELIETIFTDYNIPLFTDQKRKMDHHPLIEFVRSALETILQNWRYEPVFRAFKTDLLYPVGEPQTDMREALDQLENYCLAHGIGGKQWKSKNPWTVRAASNLDGDDTLSGKDHKLARSLNGWRHMFADPLLTFERHMKKAKTVEDQCRELFLFLEDLGVPDKIERLRNQAEEEGRLSEAREHDQAWQAFLEVLDQLVEAAGEEVLSLDLFSNVLDSGLDQLRFTLVPPALDQVIVGALDRSRAEGTPVIFVLGVNEGILPAKPIEDGLLSDEERLLLEKQNVQLAPTARDQLFYEEFLIYRAMVSASERLIVSYPLTSEGDQTLMPSSLIRRLGHYFDGLKPKLITGDIFEGTEEEQLTSIGPSSRTLGSTSQALRRWQEGYPIHAMWWEAYNYFIQHKETRVQSIKILSSRFYKNEEAPLKKETAEALYGRDIQASVSRMERFNSCPFSQFASYGLRLKERDLYRLDAPDIGQLFHSALKMMTDQLRDAHKDWAGLSQEECLTLASVTVDLLAPKLQREILLSSARYTYLKRKLEEIVGRAAVVLAKHAKSSGFSPVGLELPFGPGKTLPPLTFSLPNGGTMRLVGRIDRVDRGETEQGILLRIIDYKSGDKALNLKEVYFGLALQMLAYLDVVLTFSKEWLGEAADPAGVLYFHIHNPMVLDVKRPDPSHLETALLKAFKMKGLLLEDEEALQLMDTQVETGASIIVPFGFKKDGSLMKQSSVATKEQFEHLRHYTRQVFEKVGTEIVSGTIDISPYKLENRMPCTYCSFKSLCQFDEAQPGNKTRVLHLDKKDHPLDKIIQHLSDDDLPAFSIGTDQQDQDRKQLLADSSEQEKEA